MTNLEGATTELCGCVLNADGSVALYCDDCRPRTPQEVAATICEQVSRVCGVAVAGARVDSGGRWEVEVQPNVWRSYQELMDAKRDNP